MIAYDTEVQSGFYVHMEFANCATIRVMSVIGASPQREPEYEHVKVDYHDNVVGTRRVAACDIRAPFTFQSQQRARRYRVRRRHRVLLALATCVLHGKRGRG